MEDENEVLPQVFSTLVGHCDGCDDVTCLSMLCWSSSAYSRAGGGTPGGGAMYMRGGVNDVRGSS